MSLDPNKTYLVWNGTEFPNSTNAQFKAPAGSTIDWGDGTVETFATASSAVNTHTYTDGKTEHTIVISGLTSIGDAWFDSCSGLTSVMIGNSVTSIGNGAFWTCSKLTSVTIPNSVTSIGRIAFSYCSRLTSIIIPDSVTSIGSGAFYFCDNLIQLVLFPETPPDLASDSISDNVQSIYVQQSSQAAYKAAINWAAFADKIVGDNLYLSFVRFNHKNKEYINEKISEFTPSSSINVVQTTGNSETDVMSQNAVSKNFLPAEVSDAEIDINSSADTYVAGHPWYFLNSCNFNNEIDVHKNLKINEYISILNPDTISYENKIYLPVQTGTVVLRPNDLPTETSLVTVSSTGTPAYKKVSDFAQLNNDASDAIFFGSTYLTSDALTMSSGTTVYTPEGVKKAMMVEGEFAPTTLQFPVVANNPYFAITPNTAPTEPSVVVNAVDRTPTWKPVSELGGNALKVTVW